MRGSQGDLGVRDVADEFFSCMNLLYSFRSLLDSTRSRPIDHHSVPSILFSGSGTILAPMPLWVEPIRSRPCSDNRCEVDHCAGDLEPWDRPVLRRLRGAPRFFLPSYRDVFIRPTSPLRDVENRGSLPPSGGEERNEAGEPAVWIVRENGRMSPGYFSSFNECSGDCW